MERIADCNIGDVENEASAYLRVLSDLTSIVAIAVAQDVLSFFAVVTKTLQAKDCNLNNKHKSLAHNDIHISKTGQMSLEEAVGPD